MATVVLCCGIEWCVVSPTKSLAQIFFSSLMYYAERNYCNWSELDAICQLGPDCAWQFSDPCEPRLSVGILQWRPSRYAGVWSNTKFQCSIYQSIRLHKAAYIIGPP